MEGQGKFWLWGYLEGLDGRRRVPPVMCLAARRAYDAGKWFASNEQRQLAA